MDSIGIIVFPAESLHDSCERAGDFPVIVDGEALEDSLVHEPPGAPVGLRNGDMHVRLRVP